MTDTLLRIQVRLTLRDLTLLGWLEDHGVLTSFQIANALFPSLDFAQRRLRKLCEIGLTARFRPLKPDSGSYPYHYVIDQLGAEVVASQRGADPPRRDHARRRQWALTHRGNLAHRLAIGQFFTDLAGYARVHRGGAELAEWKPTSRLVGSGAAGLFSLNEFTAVPYHVPRVEPDGYGVWLEHGRRVPFFVEIDRATEPISTLIGKIARYRRAADAAGRAYPLLFVVPTVGRERNLQRQLPEPRSRSTWYPVATATEEEMAERGRTPAEAVWRANHDQADRLRLIDLDQFVVDGDTQQVDRG